jgi:hypothetical protein
MVAVSVPLTPATGFIVFRGISAQAKAAEWFKQAGALWWRFPT